jgi:hypothetical protein
MPAQIIAYVPDRVCYIPTQGVYSAEEFFQVDSAAVQMVEQSPAATVHFITDYRAVTQLPPVTVQSKAQIGSHPKLGWVLVIQNGNKFMQFATTVLAGIFKARLRYFTTFEEAITFLQTADPTLPDLQDPRYRQNLPADVEP